MIGLSDVQGVWRRTRLETPVALDTTTRVTWMQAGALHVDLRLSPELEALAGVPALASLDADGLRRVAKAEGFAGVTHVASGTCTWTRRINYRGPLDGPDVGTLHWLDGSGASMSAPPGNGHDAASGSRVLVETGVHADYVEHWVREASRRGYGRSFVAADGQRLVLCRTGERFALGRADPASLAADRPLGARLEDALARGDGDALEKLFDMEFCTGRIDAGHGVVERSTNPARVGERAFGPDALDPEARTITIRARGFRGESRRPVFTATSLPP